MSYKFTLEPYSGSKSRYRCPQCGDKKSFTNYIDNETGEYLGNNVGRCNHENSCGYHYTPQQYFQDNGKIDWYYREHKNYTPPPRKPMSYFDKEHLINSKANYEHNNFVKFLLKIFDRNSVFEIINKYHIGTSDYWNGATIFWYLDKRNRVCSGKVMLYDKTSGKRIKNNDSPKINSMRAILIKRNLIDNNFNQKTGLFGEHLLANKTKPICIVESEKTAIIASIQFPDFLWLASGSRAFLTKDRLKILKGRNVTLYPDNDAYAVWCKIATEYHFKISKLVKDKCSAPTADLADYILSNYSYCSSF